MLYPSWIASLLVAPLGLVLGAGLALFLERKLIGLAQKRLGISFLGRHGWAHLPADVVKFWLKQASRNLRHGGGLSLLGALGAYLGWSLLGALLFLGSGGLPAVDFWDFQLLAYLAYANLTTLFMVHLCGALRSKYSTAAAARLVLLGAFMEVFFAAALLLAYLHAGGYSLDAVGAGDTWLLAALPPIALTFGLYALFEAKRAPFDHSEAESEFVAGHLVEFGGRALLLFFVCEYAHVYFCIFTLLVFVCGGAGGLGVVWLFPFLTCPNLGLSF